MDEENARVEQANIGQFEGVLAEAEPKFDPIEQAERVLDNTAFYDFSFYEFLFPTETGYRGGLSERALTTLDEFQASEDVGAHLAALMLDVLVRVEQSVRDQVRRLRRRDWDEEQVVQDLLEGFYGFRASTLPTIVAAYQTEIDEGIGPLFLEFLAELIAAYLRSRLYQAYPSFYGFWSAWSRYFDDAYDLWHEAVNPPPVTQSSTDETGDQAGSSEPGTYDEQPQEPGQSSK
ncbi:MAG: hypothetical protein ACREYE_28795 [Gammaproteobacteria bacterium]